MAWERRGGRSMDPVGLAGRMGARGGGGGGPADLAGGRGGWPTGGRDARCSAGFGGWLAGCLAGCRRYGLAGMGGPEERLGGSRSWDRFDPGPPGYPVELCRPTESAPLLNS